MNNPYENYNFVDIKPHTCTPKPPLDLAARRFHNKIKSHILSLTNEHVHWDMPVAAIVRHQQRKMAINNDPSDLEAVIAYGHNEHKIRALQRLKNICIGETSAVNMNCKASDLAFEQFQECYTYSDHNTEDPNRERVLLYTGHLDLPDNTSVNGLKTHTMVIYGSIKMLTALVSANRMFMDGTFKTCPLMFYQMLLLNYMVNGYMLVGVYVLLTGKHKALIKWAIREAINLVQKHVELNDPAGVHSPHSLVKWTRITCDFEASIVLALQDYKIEHNLAYKVSCCYFHYCQAVLRAARSYGVVILYKQPVCIITHSLVAVFVYYHCMFLCFRI